MTVPVEPVPVEPDDELSELLEHLKDSRGLDFTSYKRSSLTRRIRKRMDGLHIDGFDDYKTHLDDHPDEFVDLFNTILINVTSFFRDPDTWALVDGEVIPRILEARADGGPLRVWVPGCASGEEPYTIAILLCEALGEDAFRQRVKIFATDLDDAALTEARHARYPMRAVTEDLPPDLLKRYFDRDGGYAVFRKDLRRSVIFGRHDLVQDPPITRIDLLSCRNTLMYFTSVAQTHILRQLHFALRPGGFLVLGRSEALAPAAGCSSRWISSAACSAATPPTGTASCPMTPCASPPRRTATRSGPAPRPTPGPRRSSWARWHRSCSTRRARSWPRTTTPARCSA